MSPQNEMPTFSPAAEDLASQDLADQDLAVDSRRAEPKRWRVQATGLCRTQGTRTVLHPFDLVVGAGEVVGIAGGSGAGKTTMLETLAGLRSASGGSVSIDGVVRNGTDSRTGRRVAGGSAGGGRAGGGHVGFVPQDDIIHLDLPLRTTLELAARLRMPGDLSTEQIRAAVAAVMDRLDLTHRAETTVRLLSGGQRKRASIAVELLTDPGVFFLDEPTSGLDPSTSAAVLEHLRTLADNGTSVIFTSHAPADLAVCDRVVFMAEGGHVAFVGPPAKALVYFGVRDLGQIYQVLASGRCPEWPPPGSAPSADSVPDPQALDRPISDEPTFDQANLDQPERPRPVSRLRQWRALTRRAVEMMVRNTLTLAILVGSPIGIVAMLTLLFPAGTFEQDAGPLAGVQALFWMTFSSFFFGVTYGLLQVVGEVEIVRRERMNGLSLGAYVCSKLAVLAPLLAAVNVLMFAVLRAFDRFPAVTSADWPWLIGAGSLISFAGVALGLFASSAVQNPAQATLALPMLCFPQVLFAGAAIPVSEMTSAGRFMSYGMANRWGLESIGRTLGLGSDLGPGAGGFVETFSGSRTQGMVVLAAITIGISFATWAVLDRRLRAR